MNHVQRNLLGLSVCLPGLAIAALFATAVPASAQVTCWYQGQQYSQGACAYTACENPNDAQKCNAVGNWNNCDWCDEATAK